MWGRTGAATWAPTENWLDGKPRVTTVDEVVIRYLAAFGPASVRDIAAWCGLSSLREVTDRLGARLRRFRTDDGVELLDLPDAPRPDPDTPAPVRFLPEYDNALLSYADRSRVIADAHHVPLLGGKGGYVGTVLVDGSVKATWALRRNGARATLTISRSLPLDARDTGEVTEEGARLLAFLTPGEDPDIAFAGP